EEVPSFLVNLKRDTMDMFREMSDLSGGKFKYEVLAPEEEARKHAAEKLDEYFAEKDESKRKEPAQKESIEDLFMGRGRPKKIDQEIRDERKKKAEIVAGRQKRTTDEVFRQLLGEEYQETYLGDLQKQGIYPWPVAEQKGDSRTESVFYTAIEIKYLNKQPEVIPLHHQLQALEYELASKITKLVRKRKPKVLFFDGRKPEPPPMERMNPMMRTPASDYSAVVNEMAELFDIDEISLKEGNSISDVQKRIEEDLKKTDDDRSPEEKPEKINCLIVAQPHELEPRQVFEISKAVSMGIPTIFLVSNYSIDVSRAAYQQGFPITFLRPGLEDLFRSWGVTLGKEFLCSKDCASVVVPQRAQGFIFQAPYAM
ncbi:MAG: Gldg family protein, partial [Thermoanaerobaculia bacterium]